MRFSWLHDMSLNRKVLIIFGTMIATTIVGVIFGTLAFSYIQVGGIPYTLIEQDMLVADNIAKIRVNLTLVRSALLTMIIDEDAARRLQLRDEITALTGRTNELFDMIDGQLRDGRYPEVVVNLTAAQAAWTAFRNTRDTELMPHILAGRTKQAIALARGIQAERYALFMKETKEAVDRVRANVPDRVDKLKLGSLWIKVVFLSGGIFFIVFYLVVAILISRTVVRPVVHVADEASRMAGGEFRRLDVSRHGGEIGAMMRNFSTMSATVCDTADHLKTSVLHLSSSSEELSATAEALSRDATDQSRQAKEVTTATMEMSQTITDVARNASQAADAAKHSSESASEGKHVVAMTAERLEMITAMVRTTLETLEGLSTSSSQIGEIVNLINTIADQTNLLALNAAIEAARAGEQGRGFAVVADEVRKLADRTTSATKDIERKIVSIQEESEKSLTAIRKGNEEVEKGLTLARSASGSLDMIVRSSTEVLDMVQRIAAATEQQSASAEEITRNMNNISTVIDHSSEATQQIQQAAHSLATLAMEIKQRTDWFKTGSATA